MEAVEVFDICRGVIQVIGPYGRNGAPLVAGSRVVYFMGLVGFTD